MKKLLLSLFAFFAFFVASAQIQVPFPPTYSYCANVDGFVSFDLNSVTPTVLGNLSPNQYSATYHVTYADAVAGINPLPSFYLTNHTQVIFVRVQENANSSNFGTTNFDLIIQPVPQVENIGFEVCDDNNDGYTHIDLGSVYERVLQSGSYNFQDVVISFYETPTDAQNQTNPIDWMGGNYINMIPFTQTLYVNTRFAETGCFTITTANLYINNCGDICITPNAIGVSQVSATSATVNWSNQGTATQWEVFVAAMGSPAPNASDVGIAAAISPFTLTGLLCATTYSVYIRSVCSPTEKSEWTPARQFATVGCFMTGQPQNLTQCFDNGQACFDLTVNESPVLANLDPLNFTVTYFESYAMAAANASEIATSGNYCLPSGLGQMVIYMRVEELSTGLFEIVSFSLIGQQYQTAPALQPVTQCDDDDNGFVTYNLTAIAAQLNTTNTITYSSSESMAFPIESPEVFTVSTTVPTIVIYMLEEMEGCDILYSVQLNSRTNCNTAFVCAEAHSLCNAFGQPFRNTISQPNSETGHDYGCLESTPNPTWFYIPISMGGNVNLQIEQNENISFSGEGLDVDFICYGPFVNPVTPCNEMLTAATIVDCSYSTDDIEEVTIPNTISGQYYLIMVTNFDDEPGYIKISEMATSQAQIECTGLSLQAFLDTNGNGAKDADEQKFPLGQFTFERNNDGNVHNITTSNGSYSIYDSNTANLYDVGFTIDPAYAANYNLTTASYNDVNIITDGGLRNIYFPITVTQSYNDLAVTIIPDSAPRPGFTYSETIMYSNLGSNTVSGTVSFIKDALTTITNISQTGTTNTADGFTYNFTNLLPFESREITVIMQVPTIPTVSIGGLLTNNANVIPSSGDIATENNVSVSAQTIIGSYDPNDKMESRGKQILISDFTNADYLYYTVRFENTGTAYAINVKISDMLDSRLDQTSVKMVKSSHDYILDRMDNALTWKFDNILLPHAAADAEGAKGFVTFKVKPKAGYAVGDIIKNKALIYFDFNPAIITNEFETEFTQALANTDFATTGFSLYPNPANHLVTIAVNHATSIASIGIYDMSGKKIMSQQSASAIETVDVSAISSGIYFLEVTTATNEKAIRKLVIE